ncbi:hypothetical protein [Gryllotalpicola protaetiae]|uniref:Uncharacterized protein n=1 Tax=Gryllotalpicola protaetiae TaxID=2419771 RepID=A0A387C4M9_9MICO|nr:hypothetical protein [Gryllotalpicola protaetiae]AYG05541.1 hypothetical protein D7I44_17850 [Gryllotalpicola protaetiae]
MSQTQQPAQQQYQQSDGLVEILAKAAGIVVLFAAVLVFLAPLVAPFIAWAMVGAQLGVKARYWVTIRYAAVVHAVAVAIVLALLVWEAVQLAAWFPAHAHAFFAQPFGHWAPQALGHTIPWLIANLIAGLLLVPAALSWKRRQLANVVYRRQLNDQSLQELMDTARIRAMDHVTARRMGAKLDPATGQIVGRRRRLMQAPWPVGRGQYAMGLVTRPTVRAWRELWADRQRVRDWVTRNGRYFLLPHKAGAARALLLAEAGTGKTTLLAAMIVTAVQRGWPLVFIDAKGAVADAENMAELVRGSGASVRVGAPFNPFQGDAGQISSKLLGLIGQNTGEGRVYTNEVRGALAAIQGKTPVRSVDELRTRLLNPAPYTRNDADLAMVENVVRERPVQTAGERVWAALGPVLRELEDVISPDGWSFDEPGADVVIVPVTPSNEAQTRLGNLVLADLRRFMGTRLSRRDTSPMLVIVDEFAQLVTESDDPSTTAAQMFETARSAEMGLVLATQSVDGLSNDEARRSRALAAGAALLVGRAKDPENAAKYAGTSMQLEASAEAHGEELRSGRVQHTWNMHPNDVRVASDGTFWIIQGGRWARVRAMTARPATRLAAAATTAATAVVAPAVVDERSAASSSSVDSYVSMPLERLMPAEAAQAAPTPPAPATPDAEIVGLLFELQETAPGQWQAIAWPATAAEVLDDEANPETATWSTAAQPPLVPAGRWEDEWQPGRFAHWGHADHFLPPEWAAAMDELLERAKARYQL